MRTWAVRVYRLAVLAIAAWLLFTANQHARQQELGPAVSLNDARKIFPSAARLGPRDLKRDGHAVLAANGDVLGFVLRTSPQTDDLIGYAGPNDLLVGLSPAGTVERVLLLSSGDTPAHIKTVLANVEFWQQFVGRQPATDGVVRVDAVSGSTLTSLAMAEAVERRLAGQSMSLRFPNATTHEEVHAFFPDAAVSIPDDPHTGWTQALDDSNKVLGYVVRTSPATDGLIGYAGPTESLMAVDVDQQTILGIRLRSSYDTPEYVERVRDDQEYLARFEGLTLNQLRDIDFVAAGIEGVSGATQTSYAVAEGLRRRAILDEDARHSEHVAETNIRQRDVGLALFVLGALWLTFFRAQGQRRLRRFWQLLLMAGFGLWFGDMLSISLVAGWSRHGVPTGTAPVLIALVAISLIVPWTSKQQIYCHQLCPHGAAQEWLGRFRRWHVHLPSRWNHALGTVPGIFLAAAFLLATFDPAFDLARLEPFDGWILKTAALVSLTIAVVSLIVSFFIPQAYCRYGCPTGALLKFVRSHGGGERFGLPEFAAAAVLSVAALWVYQADINSVVVRPNFTTSRDSTTKLAGNAFGTTWSVTIRDPVADRAAMFDQLAAELERIESRLSHWRRESETSQFNGSDTTSELEYSRELIELIMFAQSLSAATNGTYDITVAGLVDAWGYGPSGPKAAEPDAADIERLLAQTGWQKLHVSQEYLTLQKDAPELQLDLGSMLQGYAADRLFDLLTKAGVQEFLIEIGGELHCQGEWTVVIDGPPSRRLPAVMLKDAALATSGTYRPGPDGKLQTQHILSPQTGRPIESPNVLCTVIAPTGRDADAWATALFVVPRELALTLANEHHLSLLLVDRDGQVTTTGLFAR